MKKRELKQRIAELEARVRQLEMENAILRASQPMPNYPVDPGRRPWESPIWVDPNSTYQPQEPYGRYRITCDTPKYQGTGITIT